MKAGGRVLLLLLPPLVAVIAYAPSLGGGFLYDDVPAILLNRHIRDLSQPGTILRYEPARPLLGLNWALNYAVAGTSPMPYHAVNVAIHAGNAALAATLMRWMAARARPALPAGAAALGACLFAATPMAAETVAYVASRSTALAALFGLGALAVAAPALEGGGLGRRAAALALLLLALLTKEEAAAVPLLLLALDWWFVARGDRAALLGRWRVHAAFLALPALGLVLRRLATGAWLPEPALDRGQYLLTQWAAFPRYLLRAAVPFDPAFFRGEPPAPWPPDARTLAWSAAALAVVAAAVALRRRWPLLGFAVAWMAAALAPSSTIVPLTEMVVDHRAYLGLVGVSFALGALLSTPERRYFAGALLVLMVARAWHYERVMADPVSAWEDAVRRAPHSMDARRALAEAYAARRDPRAARTLEDAVRAAPQDAASWTNLGLLHAQAGRTEEAAEAFRRASAAAPGDARIADNLGLVLEAMGRPDEAVIAYERAVQGRPALAQPRVRLARLMLARGDRVRAAALLDEAARLEIDPEDARAIEAARAELRR